MPKFFPTPENFRSWLSKNHEKETELWVGFYKKATKKASITWPESVDQALCFGWIDGLRKRIDEEAYMIRFTPRRLDSHWSNVNIARIKELQKDGLVMEKGLEAWKKRTAKRTAKASYEQKQVVLDAHYEAQIKKNSAAAEFFYKKLSPSYRKQSIWWIISAKKKETQLRRLNILISSSEKEELIPPLKWTKKS